MVFFKYLSPTINFLRDVFSFSTDWFQIARLFCSTFFWLCNFVNIFTAASCSSECQCWMSNVELCIVFFFVTFASTVSRKNGRVFSNEWTQVFSVLNWGNFVVRSTGSASQNDDAEVWKCLARSYRPKNNQDGRISILPNFFANYELEYSSASILKGPGRDE